MEGQHTRLVHSTTATRALHRSRCMDLPRDVWATICQGMTTKEWGQVCGACLASYALRPFLAAEVRKDMGSDGQDLMRHLQVGNWTTCQSLCLNLWQLHDAADLTPTQIERIKQIGKALPLLRCLHIIGRPQMPIKDNNMEGVLMSTLARHVSLLSLHVKTIRMPLNLPALQHLVLRLDRISQRGGREPTHRALFPSISLLIGLKTLYIQSNNTAIKGPTDMRSCVHLQHVALQDVALEGTVALPSSCLLHAFSEPQGFTSITTVVAQRVTGLTLRHNSRRKLSIYPSKQLLGYKAVPSMYNLRSLRLTLDKKDILEHSMGATCGMLRVELNKFSLTPSLKVLELNVDCNLEVFIGSSLPLVLLVLVAAGTLELTYHHEYLPSNVMQRPPMSTLEQMYLRSGRLALPAGYRELFNERAPTRVDILESVKADEEGWTAQMPAGFQPSNLNECCCNACLECLKRAGVFILCDKAWTREGFDKHLRPHRKRST